MAGVEELVLELEAGPIHHFQDWPASHLEVGRTGVYTIWSSTAFLYVGMSYRDVSETSNPNAKGLFGRLASHASGRRSGDQFCIYICDRFVIPRLSPDELAALERGERILDRLTRDYIRSNLRYRSVVTTTGAEARILETHVRLHGLPSFGRPIINP